MKNNNLKLKISFYFLVFVFIFSFFVFNLVKAAAASLYLSPSQGTFLLGSTFSISIYVDTKESEINAVEVDLRFPPDILQVTTPTAGESFISEWITPPKLFQYRRNYFL